MAKAAFVLPSTPADRERIQGAISEICDHMTFIDSYNEKIKEVAEMLRDEFNMDIAMSKRLGKLMLMQNFQDTADKFSTLEELWEIIVAPKVK